MRKVCCQLSPFFGDVSPMMSLAHFSCSHSTPLTLTSSSSIPSSRTTSQVTLPINRPCDDPQNEEYGPVANTTSSTRSWMCKKQTSVSRSSTEAELISLDAGLRIDGIPALGLWDLVIEVFHSSPNQINKSKGQESQGNLSRNTTLHMKNQNPTKHVNVDLNNVDHVSSSVRSSRFGALRNVFEDNEALIKMIIKGRSPHNETCVKNPQSCSGLFDWINLDPKIQIRYIDTKTSTRRHVDQR